MGRECLSAQRLSVEDIDTTRLAQPDADHGFDEIGGITESTSASRCVAEIDDVRQAGHHSYSKRSSRQYMIAFI